MAGIDVGIIDQWLKKHTLVYKGATRHPFILSLRDGTIDTSSYRQWLEQDYVFVRTFVSFVASVLIKSAKISESDDMEVILKGLVEMRDEISWFKTEASKWGISLSDIIARTANKNYCRFIESLMAQEVEYAVVVTAFWAIETVYQESFAHCLEEGNRVPAELKAACERWGSGDFGEYCASLKRIADRELLKSSDEVLVKAELAFIAVLEHEIEFWSNSAGPTA